MEHLVIGRVVTRGDDDRLRVDLNVLAISVGDDSAGHSTFAVADKALALVGPANLAALFRNDVVQHGNQNGIAVHIAHARTLIEGEVDRLFELSSLIEDVGDGVLGIIRSLVIPVPQKSFKAV